MKKYLLILMAIVLMCTPLMACTVTDDTPAIKYATETQITNLQKVYDALKVTVDGKANKADVVAGVSKDYVDLKVASVAAPSMTNYYTKAEVDSAIKKAIDDYKATVTTTSGGTTAPVSTSGIVSIMFDPLSVAHLKPTYASNTATSQINFTIRLTNGTTQYQYVKVVTMFNADHSTTLNSINLQVGSFTSPIVYSYNPSSGVTTAITAMPSSGGNTSLGEIQIAPGASLDMGCWLQILTTTGTVWQIDMIPSSHT
jgi:hypothetical protein